MAWQLKNKPSVSFSPGVPFPKNFMSVAKTILKRLFRVYAHIYHQHFDPVIQLQEEAHLNTSFKHFIFFVQVRTWQMVFSLPRYIIPLSLCKKISIFLGSLPLRGRRSFRQWNTWGERVADGQGRMQWPSLGLEG